MLQRNRLLLLLLLPREYDCHRGDVENVKDAVGHRSTGATRACSAQARGERCFHDVCVCLLCVCFKAPRTRGAGPLGVGQPTRLTDAAQLVATPL